MAIFGRKPWINPFGKMSIFRVFELFVVIAKEGVFRCGISLNTFSWAILRKIKKFGKMVIFVPKPRVKLFLRMSIFRVFELFVFIAKEGVFAL